MSPEPSRRVLAGTRGTLPGTSFHEALLCLRGELGHPHVAAVPVLPARGFSATLLARSITWLTDLHADGQAFGWRLSARPSTESVAAASRWRSDLNALADVVGAEGPDHRGRWSISILGPVTLAARLRLRTGEAVLADAGARRDVAAAQAEGLTDLVAGLRRAVGDEPLQLRLLEPELHRALDGAVPTSSGLRTLRALPRGEAQEDFRQVVAAAQALGVGTLLDLGGPVPDPEHRRGFDAVAARPRGGGAALWESLAELAEAGTGLRLCVVPAEPGPGGVPGLVRELWGLWRDLGLGARELDRVVLEEEQDLSGLSPAEARQSLARAAAVAEALQETARA